MVKITEGYALKLGVPPGTSPKSGVQVFDDSQPGFGIRKFPNGKAWYFVKTNVGGQQRRQMLGSALVRGVLPDVRKEAARVLLKARAGEDIVAEKRAAEAKAKAEREAVRNRKTFGALVPDYLEARKGELRPRSYLAMRHHLCTQISELHGLDIKTITRSDVVGVIDTIAQGSGKVAADRARASLSTLFGWAIRNGYVDATPLQYIKARKANDARERVLDEGELREVWRTCLEDDYGRIVRLLILTGQRKSEIGDLSWNEINFAERQMELPGTRTKNHKPHVIPLSSEALAILASIERKEERDLVFGRGAGGFSGWSKAKAELDERIAAARKAVGVKTGMPAWVLHDLRRSFVTHLLDRKLALPHVVEAAVNHVSGHKGGVAGVYNRAAYAEEKRRAMEAWSNRVAKICA